MTEKELLEFGDAIQKMHDKLREKKLKGNDIEFQITYAAIEGMEKLYYFHKNKQSK